MACYHPLKGFAIGTTAAGKVDYKVCSYDVDHVELCNGTWEASGVPIRSMRAEAVVREFIEIPCGQCVGCRLEYSRQWANRCMLELQYHDSSYFVTLTYDDAHVPKSYYADPETGEAFTSLTLVKRDFQLFMKRLRRSFPNDDIRFFMAGEYGGQTFRPHYHAIIFGLHLDDLKPWRRSKQGFTYYNSEALQRVWSVKDPDGVVRPIGYAVVAEVTWETCAYTARYVMKKLNGVKAQFYVDHNITPEFTLMSRKPGIAAQYFVDHPDLYDYEYINIPTAKGGRKFRSPRYFDRLYDVDHPDEMKEIKKARKRLAEDAKKIKLSKTNLSYMEVLAVEERNLKERLKLLKRSMENDA